jgi:hypothetical protein
LACSAGEFVSKIHEAQMVLASEIPAGGTSGSIGGGLAKIKVETVLKRLKVEPMINP